MTVVGKLVDVAGSALTGAVLAGARFPQSLFLHMAAW